MRLLDYQFARLVRENRRLKRDLKAALALNVELWGRSTRAEQARRNLESQLAAKGHR